MSNRSTTSPFLPEFLLMFIPYLEKMVERRQTCEGRTKQDLKISNDVYGDDKFILL